MRLREVTNRTFFFEKKTIFLHVCATWSELSSNISTMYLPCQKPFISSELQRPYITSLLFCPSFFWNKNNDILLCYFYKYFWHICDISFFLRPIKLKLYLCCIADFLITFLYAKKSLCLYTECPRSNDPFYIVTHYIN